MLTDDRLKEIPRWEAPAPNDRDNINVQVVYASDYDRLAARLSALEQALKLFGGHAKGCKLFLCEKCGYVFDWPSHESGDGNQSWHFFQKQPCSCGFAAAITPPKTGDKEVSLDK